GQEVGLEFQLPGRDVPLQFKAVVRHFQGGHCGLEFLTITPEHRDAILAYGDSLDKKKRPKIIRR
ncbi:MAG TPA: PilZ domain-containing protein, partial [Terriglobales bacterium]|nr:PilZ domain-containing protein [Terriglobales bacterium]